MDSKQELFNFFAQEHNLTLLDSEMYDIVKKVFDNFSLCLSCGDVINQAGQVLCAACETKIESNLKEILENESALNELM